MKATEGNRIVGAYGTAVEVLAVLDDADPPDWRATVASYFVTAPGQSPAWEHYALSIIHLRDVPGVRPADITVPGATHELVLFALDPQAEPTATDFASWHRLTPVNVVEQVQLPDDDAARELLRLAATSIVNGALPAEPPFPRGLSPESREPWLTALVKTSAHLRGEEHAP